MKRSTKIWTVKGYNTDEVRNAYCKSWKQAKSVAEFLAEYSIYRTIDVITPLGKVVYRLLPGTKTIPHVLKSVLREALDHCKSNPKYDYGHICMDMPLDCLNSSIRKRARQVEKQSGTKCHGGIVYAYTKGVYLKFGGEKKGFLLPPTWSFREFGSAIRNATLRGGGGR